MDIHTIENESLKVTVSDSGAELISVIDKSKDYERMWDANPSVWNRHAPILFPFVGKVNNGKYTYKGQTYEMKSQHGFARDSVFQCVENTGNKITHLLKSGEATKSCYPFDFELYVTHSLDEANPRLLHVQWTVKNTGDDTMLYSIGAHPGFTVPAAASEKRSDYFIEFPDKAKLSYMLLNQDNSLAITDKTYDLDLENGFLPIEDSLFDRDALVFDNQNIDVMRIAKPDKTPYVTVSCKDFPYAGVWSKPDGKFICLEPWYGRTDDDGFNGNLEDKAGIQTLDGGCQKEYIYTIEFHQ